MELRVRNTAYVVLLMSWAALALPLLMIVMLLAGHPMVDRETGRPSPIWLELIIAAALIAVGLGLNRLARWVLNQYRSGMTAFGSDR